MKGRQTITLSSRKASYILELERKVSVIKGNSGTGKSGFDMANYAFGDDHGGPDRTDNQVEVLSAGGNANILNALTGMVQRTGRLCVNVDGAAFGAYIEPVLKYAGIRGNMMIAAPESFEYVLLNLTCFRGCNDSYDYYREWAANTLLAALFCKGGRIMKEKIDEKKIREAVRLFLEG